jgi:hypothetical protein
MFEAAIDLEDQVDELMTWLTEVQKTLSRLTAVSGKSVLRRLR